MLSSYLLCSVTYQHPNSALVFYEILRFNIPLSTSFENFSLILITEVDEMSVRVDYRLNGAKTNLVVLFLLPCFFVYQTAVIVCECCDNIET